MVEFKYRADIDGLRAIAVLLVVFYHADMGFPGGYVGVDVFFVISGFLITGLIHKEYMQNKFSFADFWLRRIRRILPAATVMVFSALVVGYFVLLPRDYKSLCESIIAQQFIGSNIYFWLHTGYFHEASELSPLLHTWSLAVEEQFYLFYPFLIVGLLYFSKRGAFLALVAVSILSFAISEWGVHQFTTATFFLLPPRAWELLLGGLLCFFSSRKLNSLLANFLSWLGITAIIGAGGYYNNSTTFPGMNALLPCLGTALLILANSEKLTWPGKLLATKPMVFVGLISYSWYLWHWPVLIFLRHWSGQKLPQPLRIAALLLSFLIAYLSWRFIEIPFRKKQLLADNRKLLSVVCATLVLLLAASQTVLIRQGIPDRWNNQVLTYMAARDSQQFIREVSIEQVQRDRLPKYGVPSDKPAACLIWGDSHAMALVPALDEACKAYQLSGVQATHSLTPPLLNFTRRGKWGMGDRAPEFNQSVVELAIQKQIPLVVMNAAWSKYANNPDFESCFSATIQQLTDAEIQVVIVKDVADQENDVPLMLAKAAHRELTIHEIGVSIKRHQQKNQTCDTIINSLAGHGVTILNPTDILADPAGICRADFNGTSLYRDSSHLSVEGALLLKPLFIQVLETLSIR